MKAAVLHRGPGWLYTTPLPARERIEAHRVTLRLLALWQTRAERKLADLERVVREDRDGPR